MILILDCDNTLYASSKGIMAKNDERINLFIKERFSLSDRETNELRISYLKSYGTTLRGLMENFRVDPDEYLEFVHAYSLDGILERNERLLSFLSRLGIPIIILTSANKAHAEKVARLTGILEFVDDIYDLKRVDYRGKPDIHAYEVVKADFPEEDAVFVDDRLLNFPPAKELGMVTVLVNEHSKPAGEAELAGTRVFRQEARRLNRIKSRIVDFEIEAIEVLDSIWDEIVTRVEG